MSCLSVGFRRSQNAAPKLLEPFCKSVAKRQIHLASISRATDATQGKQYGGPLEGTRVLDLSRILAGPYATMVLGDLGAEVIKVERPGVGDFARSWGPPFCGVDSAYFVGINRNKKSIAIDFQKPEGRELIHELAKTSDVLVENFMPGKLGEMGLGYEDLKDIAPQLVYCSITGYGSSGPYVKRGGFDVVAAAMGGLMHLTGPEDGEPCRVGVSITDISTGLYAHGAIMAALLERGRTGKGKKVDCNLLATQVAVLSHVAANHLNTGKEIGRVGTAHLSIVPYQAFKTKDGYMVIGAGNDRQFKELCKILKKPTLAEEAEFATNSLRVLNRKKLIPILTEIFSKESNNFWFKEFEKSALPCGPINTLSQAMSDPQVNHLGMVQTIKHPKAGHVKVTGPAQFFDGKAVLKEPMHPPLLGEHTEEVLKGILNLGKDKIDELVSSKIISLE